MAAPATAAEMESVGDDAAISATALAAMFQQQRELFGSFFQQLSYEEVHKFAEELHKCKGVIFFTGIGKSGFIAKKVSQTLVSTGTRAIFLAPVDALHGDIGIVQPGDYLVMLSKSGDTQELVMLAPYARAKGARVLCITANSDSELAKLADFHCRLPAPGELQGGQNSSREAPPATYTALQMLLGDTVAVALMHAKGLTPDQYAMNHPAGRIGKRLVLKVADIMKLEGLPTCTPTQNGLAALVQLAGSSKGSGCLLVLDDQRRLMGTLSDGDLRRALAANGEAALQLTVTQLMNFKKPFPRTVTADMMAFDALKVMETAPAVTYLPVLRKGDDKVLEGLITIHDMALLK